MLGLLSLQPQQTHPRLQQARAVAGRHQNVGAALVIRAIAPGQQPFIGLQDGRHAQQPAQRAVEPERLGTAKDFARMAVVKRDRVPR